MRNMPKLVLAALMTVGTLSALPAAQAATTYSQTKYPVVLVHGMFGFTSVMGMEYFYRIPADLRSNGATVYTPALSALNSTEFRGEQLLAQVKTIQAVTGAAKVNLIGHSHGGPTSRYVAGLVPNSIASITAVAGLTNGSPVADGVLKLTASNGLSNLLNPLAVAAAKVIDILSGKATAQEDLYKSLNALSTTTAKTFNAKYPNGVPSTYCGQGASVAANGMRMYSWSGTSQMTSIFDIIDPVFVASQLFFAGTSDGNDGMVGRCSSHFGQVLRDNYPQNHADEVNLLLGNVGLFNPDPVAIYRQHANRLKTAGL